MPTLSDPAHASARANDHDPAHRSRASIVLLLGGLYLLALAIRLLAASQVPLPATEPSAYYADVARNLVEGDGLVSHSVWSYATGPLAVPKPAFELWLPMSSFVSALAMSLLGSTWWAAQVGSAVLGALVAPLAWAVGRGAARAAGLDGRRVSSVSIACGLLAACLGPFVLAAAVPDSYTPFLVFALLSALLMPPAMGVSDPAAPRLAGEAPTRPRVAPGLALGVALGLAYLSRQEAIWLGLTALLMLTWQLRSEPAGRRLRQAAGQLWPIVAGGLLVTVPWLARNTVTFGSPFPGQAIENLVLVRNEDIFAFAERPSLAAYLGQGLSTILANPLVAAWEGLREVLLLTAFPVGLVGCLAIVGLRRSPALRRPTALVTLLASGGLTFLTTVLLFPVATRWGTFLHASGPLVAGLLVAAVLGTDALLARISTWRRWPQPNVVLGPAALLVVTGLLAFLQLGFLADQARSTETRYAAIAERLRAVADRTGEPVPDRLISDHPMWLAATLDRDVIALPDEPLPSLARLADRFDARWLVVVDRRGRYPEALLSPSAASCLAAEPTALEDGPQPARLFRLLDSCPAA